MSDKLQDAALHVMKQNIMKEEFGWEVPIETVPLPSRGLVYSPDTTLYNRETVPIKAMTAHEEDILTSQAFIKEGTVVNNLIRSCVTDKTFRVEDLIVGDRNALMTAIRVTGYGADYKVVAPCNNCSNANNVTVDLSELEINRLKIKPVEEGKNEFEYTLPVTKKKVTFKFLTIADDIDRTQATKNLRAKLETNITTYLKYVILSVDGKRDKTKISQFIKHMPAFDSKSIRNFIKNNEPGMDMTGRFSCKNCSYNNEFTIPVTAEFFWPDS